MRIALLTDGIYPYVMGGMQKHSYYLAKFFAQNKVLVDLYHMPQNGEYDIRQLTEFTNEEKKYIRSIVVDFPVKKKFPGHYIAESYLYSKRIFEILKPDLQDIDFIYAKGFSGWKLIEEKETGMKCPPIGVNFHGLEMFQKAPSFKSILPYFMFRSPTMYNIKKADFVFSYGGKITDLILKLNISKRKIIEVSSGIESKWLLPTSFPVNPVRKFLYIGRYTRRKGIEELNYVLQRLIGKQDFEFCFIGPIPENKKIHSPQITYLGGISNQEQISGIIRTCDVLVCPSHSEGMPNVILEGMASGLSVIATDVGAVNCLVNNDNGWLIAPGNHQELERAIKNAIELSDYVLLEKKMKCLTLIKKDYLWESIIMKTIHLIKDKTKTELNDE